jgi:hypothetical protein
VRPLRPVLASALSAADETTAGTARAWRRRATAQMMVNQLHVSVIGMDDDSA